MAPWCPACRQFTETWNKFADWGRDLDINVGVVDVTENPGLHFFVCLYLHVHVCIQFGGRLK